MKLASAYAQGAALLCVGVAAYILQDLIMKVASGSYPIHQALVFRAMTALPIAVLIIYLSGSLKSLRGSTLPMLPRSLLLVLCNLAYYLALATLPLATVGALYLSAPLMITALSVLLLEEKVNYIQWGAIGAAFAGVILIIHPGNGSFEWAMVLPLLSALAYAGAVILERKKSNDNDPGVMSLHSQAWLTLTGVVLGLLLGFGELSGETQQHPSMDFLLRGWQWPSTRDFMILLICGIVGSASTFLLTKAYTLSEASTLAPFEYTALLWSIFLGWLVFGNLPVAEEWAGIALLVGAGLVSVYAADTKQAGATAGSLGGDATNR
jgi:drug/metabolite transporter (DMT)-like permease